MLSQPHRTRLASIALAAASLLAFAPAAAVAQGVPSNAIAPGPGFRGTEPARAGEAAPERRWDAELRAFASYDSNIGLTEEQAPAPYEYEPGLRAGLAASTTFRVAELGPLRLGAGFFAAQTLTAGDSYADDYDLSTLSPQLFANAAFEVGGAPGSVQLAYQFRRDFLGGDDFELSHSLRVGSALRPLASLELGASYQVSFDDFDATGFHGLNAARDAESHRFGLQATWLGTEAGRSLGVGYEYLHNQADDANFDFDGHGTFARFRTPLPLARFVQLELLAAYTSVDYVHYTPAPQREARTQQYRAALLLPLTHGFVLDASYAYLRIGADQARFRTQRHLLSAGVSFHF
ncbi:MAG TPA: hypothetical protein VII78_14010 [Myxococcota bacterium]|jgi:hypothetical protein